MHCGEIKRLMLVCLLSCAMLPIGCRAYTASATDVQKQTETEAPKPAAVPEAEEVLVHTVTEEPITPIPTPTPTATPTPSPSPTPEPERITAAMLDEGYCDRYFDDVLFIGDSLTRSLSNYVRGLRAKNADFLGKAQFMGTVSMSVKNACTNKAHSGGISFEYRGKAISLTDGIKTTGAKKAFIMLGLNDIGYRKWEDVQENFVTMIEIIRAECPDTEIVIFGVLPVTEHYCKSNHIKIARWNSFNEILADICTTHEVTFLNFAEKMMNEQGYLKTAYANGDFHLKEAGEDIWIRAVRAYAASELYPDAIVDIP